MRKGTTPKHIIEIDIDTSTIEKIKISYAQNNNIILTKKTEDCIMSGHTIEINLTQKDTFLFDSNTLVQIQVRVLTKGGQALSSDVLTKCVKACLDDEVL